jgi:predicted acyltransferase
MSTIISPKLETRASLQDKPEPDTGAQPRLLSLDVFRGATIASMMLVNNPGTWNAVYRPLRHAVWHGWTFTDIIFPFFLWIVGVAMTLSFARRLAQGADRKILLLHTIRRAALIFALGLLLNGFPYYDLSTLRIPGVLQRIAVCYLIAGVIYLTTSIRAQGVWTAGLLLVYWLMMKLVPVPGYGAGVLDKEGNLAQYIDGLFLSGHMWAATKTWDPEGIISTLPAIATTLFGILTGHLLRSRRSPREKTAGLLITGGALLAAGLLMGVWLPINKNLWTSSYAVLMAGMASVIFGFCYWFADVKGYKRWAMPFAIYGMNAITVYVLAGLLAKTLGVIRITGSDGASLSLGRFIFDRIYAPLASPINASLLYALTYVLLFFGVSYLMFRRRWFVKV